MCVWQSENSWETGKIYICSCCCCKRPKFFGLAFVNRTLLFWKTAITTFLLTKCVIRRHIGGFVGISLVIDSLDISSFANKNWDMASSLKEVQDSNGVSCNCSVLPNSPIKWKEQLICQCQALLDLLLKEHFFLRTVIWVGQLSVADSLHTYPLSLILKSAFQTTFVQDDEDFGNSSASHNHHWYCSKDCELWGWSLGKGGQLEKSE